MRKLCIYSFYDKEGIVDRFVFDMLEEVKKYFDEIIFVSNGPVESKGKKKLESIEGLSIFERDNKGFDIGGIQETLLKTGFENLKNYDELLIINSSIMGPVFSFKEMFDEMSKEELDFWGMTVYKKMKYNPWDSSRFDYIPTHLQSFFIVIRKNMLGSLDFEKYWKELPSINTYDDAVSKHEVVFTKHFEELGYTWRAYIQSQKYNDWTNYHLNYMPIKLIKDLKCPVFKRKSFILDYRVYLGVTKGNEGRDLFNYLDSIGYDTGKIVENITRTANQFDIRCSLNSNYQIYSDKNLVNDNNYKFGIIIIIDNLDEIEIINGFIENLNEKIEINIYVTNNIKRKNITFSNANIFVHPGNIKDYLKYIQEAADKYDLLLFLSIPPYGLSNRIAEILSLETALNSFVKNDNVIKQIVDMFENNKSLGLIVPPMALHSEYAGVNRSWNKSTYDKVKDLLLKLNIKVNLDINKPSLGPLGGSFIIRSKVINYIDWNKLVELERYNNYSDSLKNFLNSIPYIVQACNLLTYSVFSEGESEIYINELLYLYLEKDTHPKNYFPAKFYHRVKGVFSEDKISQDIIKLDVDSRKFIVNTNIKYKCNFIRFDPIEGNSLSTKGIEAYVNGKKVSIEPINGYRHGYSDLFITDDPMYGIRHKFNRNDIIRIEFSQFNIIYSDELDKGITGNRNQQYGKKINNALIDIINHYEKYNIKKIIKKNLKKVKNKLKK